MATTRRHTTRHAAVAIILLTVLAAALGYGYRRYQASQVPALLDPVSEVWREQLRETGKLSGHTTISILLEVGSPADVPTLEAWGLSVRFCWATYCTATLPDGRLDQLRRLRAVKYVKFAGPAAASSGHPVRRAPVIAVIDQDIDWRDGAFWTNAGPRVIYYWDQTDFRGPAPPLGAAAYGTELTGFELARVRDRPDIVPSRRGHGTAMSIIAAGNVGAADRDLLPDIDAPIVLVNTTGKEAAVLEAVRYVMRRAEEIGLNRVINLSFGKHFGRHDGRDPFVLALDAALDERTLLVVAIGNDAVRGIFAEERVRDVVSIPFVVKQGRCAPGTRVGFELEGWYENAGTISLRLEPPGGAASTFVEPDHVAGGQNGAEHFLVDTRLRSRDGASRGVHITGQAACRVGPDATWRITARSAASNGRLQFWVTQTKDCEVIFPRHRNPGGAVSAVAASRHALSVGAYLLQDGRAEEARFSSFGRTGDGRWKPDLLAPTHIAVGTDAEVSGGSSAAAAVASRLAARLWERAPGATASDLRRALTGRAVIPSGSSLVWIAGSPYQPETVDVLEQRLAAPAPIQASTAAPR